MDHTCVTLLDDARTSELTNMDLVWTKKQCMKLLDVYQKQEVLWNPNHKDYRIRDARRRALENMIGMIGRPNTTAEMIRRKIRRFRALYSHLKKNWYQYNIRPTNYWFNKADSFLGSVYHHNKGKNLPIILADELRSYKNKTPTGEWKTTRLLPIIFQYERYPILWNTAAKEHKNREMYYEALLKLKKKVGGPEVTVLQVQKKLEFIKQKYREERAKFLFEDVPPKRYWYDVADRFLQKVVDAELLKNMTIEDIDKVATTPVAKERLLKKIQELQPQAGILPGPKPVTKTYTRSKKPIERANTPVIEQNQNSADTDNEFKIFGQLIAAQLKKMPLNQALNLLQEMQTMINKTRLIPTLQEEQPSSSTSDAVYFEMGDIKEDEDIIIVKLEKDD
ncbi:uncharacterized protein LOC105386186 [Plutella xylostella]|uniref:uncharacterized protein LOC105386186 n=1 Tax=Plutella xylostella TaxID=51655 RepID=UPI002032BC1D|nr:uncharacterized protein LOC105386186 [Plutella xylostella]